LYSIIFFEKNQLFSKPDVSLGASGPPKFFSEKLGRAGANSSTSGFNHKYKTRRLKILNVGF